MSCAKRASSIRSELGRRQDVPGATLGCGVALTEPEDTVAFPVAVSVPVIRLMLRMPATAVDAIVIVTVALLAGFCVSFFCLIEPPHVQPRRQDETRFAKRLSIRFGPMPPRAISPSPIDRK